MTFAAMPPGTRQLAALALYAPVIKPVVPAAPVVATMPVAAPMVETRSPAPALHNESRVSCVRCRAVYSVAHQESWARDRQIMAQLFVHPHVCGEEDIEPPPPPASGVRLRN